MALIIVRHKVSDFAAWKKIFDQNKPAQTGADFSNPRVYRSAGDPNEVVVLIDASSIEKARAFGLSPEVKAQMATAGVIDQPTVYFLNPAD